MRLESNQSGGLADKVKGQNPWNINLLHDSIVPSAGALLP